MHAAVPAPAKASAAGAAAASPSSSAAAAAAAAGSATDHASSSSSRPAAPPQRPPRPLDNFHPPGCRCARADCPARLYNSKLTALLRSSSPLRELDTRIIGIDTNSDVAVAGENALLPREGSHRAPRRQLRRNEGNRLGCKARKVTDLSLAARKAARALNPSSHTGEALAVTSLTLGEIDRAVGRAKQRALVARWGVDLAPVVTRLSSVSNKTAQLPRLAAYNAAVAEVRAAWWASRSRLRVNRLAFGVFCRQRACLDAFWSRLRRGDGDACTTGYEGRTLIAFGAASFASRYPNRELRSSAERTFGRHLVLRTSEYNSTKRCKACQSHQLQEVVNTSYNRARGSSMGASLHSLRRCFNAYCEAWVDRDVNVSLPDEGGGAEEGGGGA